MAKALKKLSPERIEQMRQAVVNGYVDQLNALLEQVREDEPEVAGSLQKLADNYEYERLNEILRNGESYASPEL